MKNIKNTLRGEKGFTFIEIVIAIALVGLISGGFLSALASASRNSGLSDERATAESLARTEMEYIRNSVYVMANWNYALPEGNPSWDADHELPAGYEEYSLAVSARPLRMIDDGIQSITITVSHGDRQVLMLEDYKVIRGTG
jgi:prepilin-type N-terminal cleavage/methylation domain-containing protein